MNKKSLRLFTCLIAAGFSVSLFSACDILGSLSTNSNSSSSSVDEKDWGEIWENWGADDWLDGEYEEYDPSQNYNKIDWTGKYPGLNSEKATDVTPTMTIYGSQHVQLLQAEKAILSGQAKVENGHHVGYFQDGASITWTIQSEKERDMLMVVNTSSPESENRYGLSMLDSYVVTVNDQAVDVSDGWLKSTKDWNTYVENVVGECKIKEGENVIKIVSTGGTNVDYLKLIPAGELSNDELIVQIPGIKYTSNGLKVEAEEMDFVGADVYAQGSGGILGSTSSATSVSTYIDASEETKVQFVLNGLFRVDDGSYPANAAGRFTLKLNGQEVDLSGATLSGVGDQDLWYKEPYTNNKLAEITLKKGTNLIEFSLKTGEINLDYFKFLPLGMGLDEDIITSYENVYSDGVKVQVEDTKHSGATVQKAASGKILGITSAATSVEFVLNAEAATNVEFILNGLFRVDESYSGIVGDRFTLIVNDEEIDLSSKTLIGSENLEQWWLGTYSSNSFGNIALKAGENTIKLSLKTGEINLDYIQFKQAACEHVFDEEWTSDGEYHWHEALCGHDEAVEKLPHDWKDATCTEAKTCETCGKTEGSALGHDEVKHDGQEASCTEKGWVEYVTCTKCDYTTYEEIPATGHTDKDSDYKCDNCKIALCTEHEEEILPAKKATCTESGLTEGKKCSICGEVLVAQTTVPALGHTEETVAGKPATCTEAGLTDGKKCSVCGETLVAQEVISALGHKEEVLASKAPSYAEAGLTEGKKCSVCGEILVAQEKIPALAYEYADGLKVEVENTDYINSYTQDGYGTGTILGGTSDQTEVSFIVKAAESQTVEFFLNALIKVDASYSAVTGDRFGLTVNGEEVDLSEQTIIGSDNANEWWKGLYTNNSFGKITLQEGENLIVLSLKTNEMNLDYISFVAEGSEVEDPYAYDYSDGMKVELENTKFGDATVQNGASGSILGITSPSTKLEFSIVTDKETNVEFILYGLIRVDDSFSGVAGDRFTLTVNDETVDLSKKTLEGSDNASEWWLGTYANSSFGVITLKEGKNVIKLALKTGEINLDYFTLVTEGSEVEDPFTFNYESGMTVEAEKTNFAGATIQDGASGKILGITSEGTKLSFNVVTTAKTNVEFVFNGLILVNDKYSGVAGDRFILTVNGETVDLSAQTLIGSDNLEKWWEGTYASSSFGVITLKEGNNSIVLALKTNEINLDYITLTTCEVDEEEPFTYDYSDGMKVELEETNFVDATVQDGASGKILGITSASTSLEFNVVTKEETNVEFLFNGLILVNDKYSGIAGDRFILAVNGVDVDLSSKTLVGSDNASEWWKGAYTTNSFGVITLQEGKNVIKLALKTNEINLDYVKLVAEGVAVQDPYTYEYSDGVKVEVEDTKYSGATVQNGASGKILGITSEATKLEFYVVAKEATYVEFILNGLIKVDADYSDIAGYRFALMVNGEAVDLSSKTLAGSDNVEKWWEGTYVSSSFGSIALQEGKNTIVLSLKSGEINLDYITLVAGEAPAKPPFTFDYEDGMKVEVEDTNFASAATQGGYGTGTILGSTSSSTKLEFNVIAQEDMYVEFILNALIKVDGSEYSAATKDRFSLTVNGEKVDLSERTLVGSNNEASWWLGDYTDNSFGSIALNKGKNTIVLLLHSNEINLDYITLKAGEAPEKLPFTYDYESGMKVEVEDTNFANATVQPGASGSILGITDVSTKLEFNVIADAETQVEVIFNGLILVNGEYPGIAGDRFILTVNGVEVDLSSKTLVGSDNADRWWEGTYASSSFGNITLNKGNNKITLSLKTNEINMDYIQLI